MADSSGADATLETFLDGLVSDGAGVFFDDPDIRRGCVSFLKDELGCKPPANTVLYWCFKKAFSLVLTKANTDARAWLLDQAHSKEHLGKMLLWLANLNSKHQQKTALKAALLDRLPQEARDDGAFQADINDEIEVISAVYMGAGFDQIKDEIADLRAGIMGAVEQLFIDQGSIIPGWDAANKTPKDSAVYSLRYDYDPDQYKLQGREGELETLKQFLGTSTLSAHFNKFQWLCLTGAGGEGKTRLAFDFANALPSPWVGYKMDRAKLEKLNSNLTWIPQHPSLFIIDYPAQIGPALKIFMNYLVEQEKFF